MSVRDTNFEAIVDGKWHWCPAPHDRELAAGVNDISVVVPPTEPGHKPASEHHRLFAQYETTESGLTYLGDDIYASQGKLRIAGQQVLAVVTSWPAPDFMGTQDAAWFLRAWTEREVNAGHFHMPFLYILEEDTVSKLRATK